MEWRGGRRGVQKKHGASTDKQRPRRIDLRPVNELSVNEPGWVPQ